ncbi:MAG TPA: universal stress protein [Actinomycetospora sp.]|nr:universal stress protein [Actinomycetospora sp.]
MSGSEVASATSEGDRPVPRRGAIAVGVSLRGHGEAAVRWAAAEARDRGLPLRLVLGLVIPRGSYPGRSLIGVDPVEGLRALARRELRDASRIAHEVAPGVPVSEDVVESDPVGVLRAQARTASTVVVGSDGFGRLGDLVLGGIARGLAGRVDVPVVIVPRDCDPQARERRGGFAPVVVGDDGTPGSLAALRFAAARAAARHAPLVIVRATTAARRLSEDVPELGSTRPATVRVVLAEARADRVLADQARDAELVVLGVGRHGWAHHHPRTRPDLVLRARCPVVIVPPDRPIAAAAGGTKAHEGAVT